MKKIIFQTGNEWAPLILRVLLGLIIFAHGSQKLLGWWGGYGFTGTMNFFTQTVGLPSIIAFLVIILESIGSIALIAGFATRILAVSYTFLAIGIVFTSHIQNGFFMNWFGNQKGEGYEYFILWVAISTALLFLGSGKYSIDKNIVLKD
jgi:putative oxidoreductase